MIGLPELPRRRRIIIVVDTTTQDRMSYTDVREITSNPEVAIVNAQEPPEDNITKSLERQGLLRPGNVLVQSPFRPDGYEPITEAADLFANEKFLLFSQLCQQLGARKVLVDSIVDEKTKSSLNVSVGSNVGKVAVKGSTATTAAESFASKLRLEDSYSGGDPDIEQATRLLVDRGLDNDPELRSLVESRAFVSNVHGVRNLVVDLSRETDRALTIAAELKVPVFFSVKADLKKVVASSAHYRVTYKVEFP